MANFEKTQPGDKVYSLQYGAGTIIAIDTEEKSFPSEADFEDGVKSFTLDGKYRISDKHPTLFWDGYIELKYDDGTMLVVEEPPPPKRKVEMEVWLHPQAAEQFTTGNTFPGTAYPMYLSEEDFGGVGVKAKLIFEV
jgi:hypothetical protein